MKIRTVKELLNSLSEDTLTEPWIIVSLDEVFLNYIISIHFYYHKTKNNGMINKLLNPVPYSQIMDFDSYNSGNHYNQYYILRDYKTPNIFENITYAYKKDHINNMKIIASFLSDKTQSVVNAYDLNQESGYSILIKKFMSVPKKNIGILIEEEEIHNTFYKIKYLDIPNIWLNKIHYLIELLYYRVITINYLY